MSLKYEPAGVGKHQASDARVYSPECISMQFDVSRRLPSRNDQIYQSQISDSPWQTPPNGMAVKVNLGSGIDRFGPIVRAGGQVDLPKRLGGDVLHSVVRSTYTQKQYEAPTPPKGTSSFSSSSLLSLQVPEGS